MLKTLCNFFDLHVTIRFVLNRIKRFAKPLMSNKSISSLHYPTIGFLLIALKSIEAVELKTLLKNK